MASQSAPSMRVLTRSPGPVAPLPRPLTPDPQSSTQGVVVVGFISRRPDYSAHLINRVLDSNAFGSGNLDKILRIDRDDVRDWFKFRRISYYHEQERGILYLQFCSTQCPVIHGSCSDIGPEFDSAVEEREFGELQGMLFMFSVCHIIIYIQEGSRFDMQSLKDFRVLQAAKHALAPVVRSRTMLPSQSRSHSSSSRPPISVSSSSNTSPGRSGITNRNGSAISLMSGLGSYASLFPGQCTPVILFVFVDDYMGVASSGSNVDETGDVSSVNPSTSLSTVARSNLPGKGPGSVVVLARPINKSEGSFRKKLQSSLEAQIRFLINKCRTLSSNESSHVGPRSGGVSSLAPLFLLDASRIVVLLDRLTNQRDQSLEFAISLVDEVLNGKATSDSLLLEGHSQSSNKEDVLSIKEFINRQADVLRGKGGLVASTNSGSAAGVGMVAVAAAAAAASVASGKAITAPELPALEAWLSSSETVLQGILTAKRGCIEESDAIRRRPRQRNVSPPQVESTPSRGIAEPLDIAVSWLERGKGLNTKFSTLWCQRALPSAKEVYVKDLPACYPTSEHKTHLERALHAFHSMVKGPAVPKFAKVLEDECASIWRSGRQQCDAVSLTRRPCMHQRHDVETGDLLSGNAIMPHSSGYIFLHACACGRSRRLIEDPFDFDSANVTNCFSDCDKLLPALQLPETKTTIPIKSSSWSLMRLGSSIYYEASKGLLQSGFFPGEKFLLKWTLYLEKQKRMEVLQPNAVQSEKLDHPGTTTEMEPNSTVGTKRNPTATMNSRDSLPGNENLRQADGTGTGSDNRKINFGRGLPNFTMKKPFSEVVAGSVATNSGFPPLQQRKQSSLVSEKVIKQKTAIDRTPEKVHTTVDHEQPGKPQEMSSNQDRWPPSTGFQAGDPFLRIGSNIVPVNMIAGEKIKPKTSLKHVVAYIGFEHECPHGHRFLLNTKYLNELGSFYESSESGVSSSESALVSSQTVSLRFSEIGGHEKVHSGSSGTASGKKKLRNTSKFKGTTVNGNMLPNTSVQLLGQGKEYAQSSASVSGPSDLVENVEEGLTSISLDDGGDAFSLLNRNLPLYMICPHCKHSKKDTTPKVRFAGKISQLQRIFVVTPPFPVTLATNPVIQFEPTCLPSSIANIEEKSCFGLGSRVILPPESFLVLKLPFVYGVQMEDKSLLPLNPFEHQPELTAWISKGTALLVVSEQNGPNNAGCI